MVEEPDKLVEIVPAGKDNGWHIRIDARTAVMVVTLFLHGMMILSGGIWAVVSVRSDFEKALVRVTTQIEGLNSTLGEVKADLRSNVSELQREINGKQDKLPYGPPERPGGR